MKKVIFKDLHESDQKIILEDLNRYIGYINGYQKEVDLLQKVIDNKTDLMAGDEPFHIWDYVTTENDETGRSHSRSYKTTVKLCAYCGKPFLCRGKKYQFCPRTKEDGSRTCTKESLSEEKKAKLLAQIGPTVEEQFDRYIKGEITEEEFRTFTKVTNVSDKRVPQKRKKSQESLQTAPVVKNEKSDLLPFSPPDYLQKRLNGEMSEKEFQEIIDPSKKKED